MCTGKTYLLVEDDCAVDSRAYFESELLSRFGLTTKEFISGGERTEHGYKYNGYLLEMFECDRHWHLSYAVD